ncbi:30S ribosomal protein S4 [Candidatus Woesearchaeota archaeon]|nr:30S ribosomal protein S4 [Candidatus Woesearchaeota archaeon]
MGDPKRFRKKYETPLQRWNKTAIETEKVLVRDFGLKNKQEILIANSFLRRYKNIAKKLIALTSSQAEKERAQVLDKLFRQGFLPQSASLDQILGLELKDILERRLQSQIVRKGLARTMKQARQFVTHRHILVGNKEITSPSFLVSRAEESVITFKTVSPFAVEEHPERMKIIAEPAEEEKPVKGTRKTAATEKKTMETESVPAAPVEE